MMIEPTRAEIDGDAHPVQNRRQVAAVQQRPLLTFELLRRGAHDHGRQHLDQSCVLSGGRP